MKKIDLGVVVTTLIIVTISCSLAFFAARIVGNPKDINLVAKNVAITFTDTSSIADETISPGWNNVKSFTITNNSKEDFNYNILLKGLVNTFESINTLQYKITSDTGYNMDNYLNIVKTENSKDVVLAYDVVIPKGSKQTYQVEFKYISIDEDQSSDMGKKLGGTLAIEESTGKPKIYDKLLSDNPTIKTRTDFSTIFTETNVNTLYKATESIAGSIPKDVYYFAGNARNNWVKFGIWKETKKIVIGYNTEKDNYQTFNTINECNQDATWNENCKEITLANKGDDMYWRIIKTNADGSVRLLYSGTGISNSYAVIGSSKFSATAEGSQGSEDAGYMYGISGSIENNRLNTNSSLIKQNVDNWYKTNLINETKYLSTTAVYCNDRETSDNTGYINVEYGFAATERLRTNKTPTYYCANVKDAFSVSNSFAKLTYPVALMTADEVVFAGSTYRHVTSNGYFGVNANNENITGKIKWWLMTPAYYLSYEKHVAAYDIIHSKSIGENVINDDNGVSNDYGIRPVISINGDNIYKTGDGSATNPYEVVAEPVNTYTVSLSVNNGSGAGTVLVEEGKDAKFTVAPNSGYKAELETNTCGGTLSGNSYTISNITSNKTCSIAFKKNGTSLATLIRANAVNENGYRYEGSNPNNYIYMVKNGSNELWRIIGLFPDGANGEEVIRVRKVGYQSASYDSNEKNHWPTSTLYNSLKGIYSTVNYKNTVNFKFYLGTSGSYDAYTSADLFNMERMNNGGRNGPSVSGTPPFIGSVGLMYPSDYGYAVLASDCERTIKPSSYYGKAACKNNNWLFQGSSGYQWLISPRYDYAGSAFVVTSDGYINYSRHVSTTDFFSPVMALRSNVMVTGSGTQSNPYVMN